MQQETIYELAMKYYLVGQVEFAKWGIMAITAIILFILVLIILTLIKFSIVNPIIELTEKI